MGLISCVGCWMILGKTGQWIEPERIAVNLRITGIDKGFFELATLSRALALGRDPTPPL